MDIRKAHGVVVALCAVYAAFPAAVTAQPGLDSATPVGAYLDGIFPSNSPGSASGDWTQIDYYPALNFVEPIRIVEHPTQNKLIIVGKDGKGWQVTHQQGATDKTLFFDIGPIMHGKSGAGEGGISDMVFHPEFGDSGSSNSAYVYISYRWEPNQGGTFDSNPTVDGYNRLSRFSVVNGVVDLGTELPMITQFDRSQNHIGMDMFFGDDGLLYISAGDEGNCCNRSQSTQRLDGGLWSGMLRIDVDQDPARSHPIRRQPTHPGADPTLNGPEWPLSFTQGYTIPDDNPFLDEGGGNLEEFYSIGLRHPWVVSRDPQTGNIWAADVGQNAREEINLVERADNHQWAYLEGTVNGVIPPPSQIIGNEAPPVWEYPHTEGQAVIGAGVYRGSKFPEFYGKYLFSDFLSGRLWTATATGNGYTIDEIGAVTNGFPNGINSYLLDSNGDILLARTAGGLNANGRIQMLERSGAVPPAPEPPQFLSQTGAFSNMASLVVHPGCVPYDLNVPFWSDAALKYRWLCVPNDGTHDTADEKIGFSETGDWEFPVGAVLIKHFEILLDTADSNSNRRLETRFLVHAEDGYYGVTYRWDEFGVDAELLTTSEDLPLSIQTPTGPLQQTWHFPSRQECMTCHSTVSGGVLGPNTRQLNRTTFYPPTGRTSNQLETLNALGMFSPTINDIQNLIDTVLTSTPSNAEDTSLSARARSYLDSNCGYCHRPNGVRANFDARLSTPLLEQGLINGILDESFGVEGEAVVVPGSLAQSVMFQRAATAGEWFSMPPLAKDLVDTAGMSLLQDWIVMLAEYPVGNDTSSDGSFIDGHHPSLFINEQDIFIQDNEPGTLTIKDFKFYVRRLGNPITPLVVRVNGDNDFTVLAIGTTRTQSDYDGGENIFPFDDTGDIVLSLAAGERIATGFMDSNPDGTGWGDGSVIPADGSGGAGQDEIWALLPAPLIAQNTGYQPGRDTPVAVVGEPVMVSNAGKALQEYTTLRRSYKFAITFSLFEGGEPPEPPPSLVTNGSFELPEVTDWESFSGANDIPGWTITSGSIEVDRAPWPAAEGQQSIDLNGTNPGALEQLITGLQPGASYELSFAYALHKSAPSSRSANVLIDGAVVSSVTATSAMKPPNYQAETIAFVAPGSGSVTIGFASTSGGNKGVILDDVRVVLTGGGGPPVGPVTDSNGAVNEVNESAAPGALTGITAFAEDPDGDSVSYSLTTNPNNAFAINSASGVVSVASSAGLDFETAPTVQIVVQAASTDGSTSSAPFTITILDDPNEGSPVGPVTDSNGAVNEVNESAAPGALTGITAFAEDPDGDSVSYSLTTNPNNAFTINSASGVVSVASSAGLDFETAPTVQIVVQAASTDGSTSSAPFTITILDDPNEDPVEFVTNGSFELPVVTNWESFSGANDIPDWTITSGSIEVDRAPWPAAEGQQSIDLNGTNPGALEQLITGLQPGASYELSFAYALHKSAPSSRSANVLIDGAVVLSVTATSAMKPPNYQAETIAFVAPGSGSVTIGFASTSGGNKGVILDDVRVVLTGGSGSPVGPVTDIDGALNEVNESAAPGALAGITAFAEDPDGDSVSYSLTTNPNNAFTINATSGVVSVASSAGLDFETAPTVQIVVQAASTDGSTSSAPFTITILDDPNEGSPVGPVTDSNGAVNEVNESAAPGALAGITAFAEDPDGDSVSYSLTTNPNNAFAINATSGVVSVASSAGLDFETAPTVQIVVQAASTDGSISSAPFTITILDDPNEGSPVGPVTDSDGAVNEVNESAAPGALAGITAFAEDPDGDSVSYSLTTNPNNAFAINATSGVVSVASSAGLDFETAPTVQIVVQAASTDGSTSSAPFTITILDDPNEDPVEFVTNGSFELPVVTNWESFSGANDIPGWTITSGSIEVDRAPWPAAEGQQSIDLNGTNPGALEQLITGLQPGASYELSFAYALHKSAPSSRSANVLIDGAVVLSVTATSAMKPPNYQAETIAFVAPGSGSVTIGFASTSGGNKGVILDDVRVVLTGGGGPPVGPVTDSNGAVNEVNESAAPGALTGITAFAEDPDGDSVSYSLTTNPNNAFTINSASGVVSVASSAGLDFETAPTVQIVVQAASTDGSTSSAPFDIVILDDPNEPSGIVNGGFENGLSNWSFANVALTSSPVFEGANAVDLQTGHIEQTISGLTPGNQYYIALAYRDKNATGGMADAEILLNGTVIGEIHTVQRDDYINCNGFEFIADSQAATLRIESLESNSGALIDNVRLVSGLLPAPPSTPWNDLTVMGDARGGRQLVNGGFEAPIGSHLLDPDNSGPDNNPHVCGDSLPGWRVTQENVDVISQWTPDPEGDWVLDTGGHGPGGIAQTITGLQPNATYTLSFWYARHGAWGTADMTGEVLANDVVVETLVRTNAQKWNTGGYEIKEVDMMASPTGSLTIEIRSTTEDQGGNIIYDDIRLIDPNN